MWLYDDVSGGAAVRCAVCTRRTFIRCCRYGGDGGDVERCSCTRSHAGCSPYLCVRVCVCVWRLNTITVIASYTATCIYVAVAVPLLLLLLKQIVCEQTNGDDNGDGL